MTAVAFASAVGSPVSQIEQGSRTGASDFVAAVMSKIENERDKLESRRKRGQALAVVPAILTPSSVSGALLLQPEPPTQKAVAMINANPVAALSNKQC